MRRVLFRYLLMEPVAPMTIERPLDRSVAPILIVACLAASNVATTVRLLPEVMAMSDL